MLIHWKPEKESHIPIFRQIVSHFEEGIKGFEYRTYSRLPSQRELSKLFDVNRSTIALAMDELKALGLIVTNGKGGTRVAELPDGVRSFNWSDYVEGSMYYPNREIIQTINNLDFDDHIIKLSSGAAMPESFKIAKLDQLIKEAAQTTLTLDYTEPKGLLSLRAVLSEHLSSIGIKAKPEEILVVNGALQAIQLIALGLLQTGSTAFIEKPSYLYSLNILKSFRMNKKGIACDVHGIKPSALYKAISRNHHSMLYTIPNYQNPTGRVMPIDRRKKILEVCEELNIPILEDDVYRELWIDEPPPPPLKSMERGGQVLYIGSVSKHLSPGLRIGWIVGPESVMNRLSDIKMQVDYGASTLSQIVTELWFKSDYRETALNEIRSKLKNRRNAAIAALDKYMADLGTWKKPKGGFYIWIDLNKQISEAQLFQKAIDAGVLIYPGHVYGTDEGSAIRISYSSESEERIEEGIRILSNIIRNL
ncbi:MAG: PLP-dependent aminotransferase family protein [Clostridia bacterium]|nr:PLP-dependent aminotransferase family protein [Clostridia bacterium]